MPDGTEGYTRNGNFEVSANGILQTRGGLPVLGQRRPDHGAPDVEVAIGVDGTVSTVAAPAPATAPAPSTSSSWSTARGRPAPRPDGFFRLAAGGAAPPTRPSVAAGYLEGSNVNVVEQMVSMISWPASTRCRPGCCPPPRRWTAPPASWSPRADGRRRPPAPPSPRLLLRRSGGSSHRRDAPIVAIPRRPLAAMRIPSSRAAVPSPAILSPVPPRAVLPSWRSMPQGIPSRRRASPSRRSASQPRCIVPSPRSPSHRSGASHHRNDPMPPAGRAARQIFPSGGQPLPAAWPQPRRQLTAFRHLLRAWNGTC